MRKASGLLAYSRNAAEQKTSDAQPGDLPSLTSLCCWVPRKEQSREPDEEQSVEQLRHRHGELDSAISLAREFASMVRERQVEQFESW